MGQLTQLTLNNGTKDLVFKPQGIDANGVATLVHGTGVILGDKHITISSRNSASRRKGTIKLDLPVVVDETINAVSQPKQVRKAYLRMDFDFSVMSTTAERTTARNLMISALDQALIKGVIDDNDSIY